MDMEVWDQMKKFHLEMEVFLLAYFQVNEDYSTGSGILNRVAFLAVHACFLGKATFEPDSLIRSQNWMRSLKMKMEMYNEKNRILFAFQKGHELFGFRHVRTFLPCSSPKSE